MMTAPNMVMNGTCSRSAGSSAQRNPTAAKTAAKATTQRNFPPRKKGAILDRRRLRSCRRLDYKVTAQARALANQLTLNFPHIDRPGLGGVSGGQRGTNAGRLARRHDDRHHAVRAVRFMRARD